MKFKKLLKIISYVQPIQVATWHEGKIVDCFNVDGLAKWDERCIALGEAIVHEAGMHVCSKARPDYLFIDLEV